MESRDLLELLVERPVVHPTFIDGVAWRGRKLTVAVRGHRWWENADTRQQAEGTISLVFDRIGLGRLLTDEFDVYNDEALDDLEVTLVAEVPWAKASNWSIYCSSPISEPLTLFRVVHDYIQSCDAFLGPEDFLNQANDLSKFTATTQSNGFLIGRGPSCIRDLICNELDQQSVTYNVIESDGGVEPAFLVRLGNSAFVCESASAEFLD